MTKETRVLKLNDGGTILYGFARFAHGFGAVAYGWEIADEFGTVLQSAWVPCRSMKEAKARTSLRRLRGVAFEVARTFGRRVVR